MTIAPPSTSPEPAPPAEPRRNRIFVTLGAWRHALLSGLGALVGILLAFGIDAWWDFRSDRGREAAYLDALRGEMVANRVSLTEHMRSRTEAIAIMRHYVETVSATDPRSGSLDTVTVMLTHIAPYFDYAPQRAALDDLVGSGGLQLIGSDSLRRALAAYEQALVLDRSMQDDLMTVWRMQISPYLTLHANWPVTTRINPRVAPDAKPRDMDYPFVADLEAFYGNRTYANLLMVRMLTEQRVRRRQQEVILRIDALLSLLNPRSSSAGDQ